jgi:hypothetical protein
MRPGTAGIVPSRHFYEVSSDMGQRRLENEKDSPMSQRR